MLIDAFCDLVLGGRCVGCEVVGRPLCASCRDTIIGGSPVEHRPTPCPSGFPATVVTGRYEGCWPPLLAAYKEHGVWGLAPTLAECLWPAVRALVDATGVPTDRLVLVPLPSRAAAIRERGLDTTAALARRVSRRARRDGQRLPARSALHLTRRVVDSTGLDATARRMNLAGAIELSAAPADRWRRERRGVILCDDLVTTGATVAEAARAISTAGVPVVGAVALVATPRLRPAPRTSRSGRATRPD